MTHAAVATLTLNPALDVSTSVPALLPNHKMRGEQPVIEPGGGGVNVARVCRRLGVDTEAVVLLGGPTGDQLRQLLEAEGVRVRIVPLDGVTRQSITITDRATNQLYRLVLPGPPVDGSVAEAARAAMAEASTGAGCVVVSGSVPPGAPDSVLSDVIAASSDTPVIVDTSGPALGVALAAGADLVKPSARELASLVGRELHTETEIVQGAAEVLRGSATKALVVSIGAGGCFLVTHDEAPQRFRAPTVRVVSSVGAGDSMVAGIAVSLGRGLSMSDAVAYGVAAGTAAVLTSGSQLCESAAIDELLPLVTRDT